MSVEQFWYDLEKSHTQLSSLPPVQAMELINTLLQRYFPKISAELQTTPDTVPQQYELIFTAHGAIEYFLDVMALAQAARPLALFSKVTAFRMRANMAGFEMRMNEFSLSPTDVLIQHYADGGRAGLTIWFGKPIAQDFIDHAKHMTFILLDHALGEYDLAIKIGVIEFASAELVEGMASLVALDQFPAVFDQFWRNDLKHSAVFPVGEHEWVGFTLTSQDDPDDVLIVQRNESAQALVCRADLAWRLQVEVELDNSAALEQVRSFEDQLSAALEHAQEGISTQILLHENVRTMDWHVCDIVTAVAQAEAIASRFPDLQFNIDQEFDPQWRQYLRWVE